MKAIVQVTVRREYSLRSLFFLVLLTPLFLACEKIEYGPEVTRQFGSETATVQEVRFSSGDFTIVGDLRIPVIGDVHPTIVMVHGSGNATRHGAVDFIPMIEIFLRNGFAVLSWDKPGSGESEGKFENGFTITDRAGILTDAVQVLKENPSIDPSNIGLWGLSQAGWVMPKALDLTDNIAFMIVVSGGGEDGIEQGAYQVAQMVACDGGSEEEVQTVEQYWALMNKATDYEQYREAGEILLDIPGLYEATGLVLSEEEQWSPWPRDIDAFFDPMEIIRRTTIPVLAFFGELDKNIDPVQGMEAYEASLQAAGNKDFLVKMIDRAGHVMSEVETGCIGEYVSPAYMNEYLETLELWLLDR